MAVCNVAYASQLRSGFLRLDAEFFKPEYVQTAQRISTFPNLISLGRISERVTQGSNPVFSEAGLACVNGKNVYFGTMTEGEPNFVSSSEFKRLENYELHNGDLVITLKHATKVGRTWIVEDDEPRIFSRNVGLIRLRPDAPILRSVLLLYLWSGIGQLLIDRCATGGTTGQITLPMSELKRLPVPLLGDSDQEIIDTLFWQSRIAAREAKESYLSAQQLLEAELGLDKLRFDKPVGYTARFSTVGLSETFFARRIDSQCFAPDALFYEKWLRSHARCDRLGTLIHPKAKGRQQVESPQGNFDYCSIKHISGRELVGASKCFLGVDTPVAGTNDLLLAITGATIGKIGIVKRYQRLAFSGDLLMLRAKSEINPNYLLLALDHKIGQVQFFRWITGSTNGHLSPRDAGQVFVPRLEESIEEKIAHLVETSLSKRIESEQLLDQAKARVEKLIEEAVTS